MNLKSWSVLTEHMRKSKPLLPKYYFNPLSSLREQPSVDAWRGVQSQGTHKLFPRIIFKLLMNHDSWPTHFNSIFNLIDFFTYPVLTHHFLKPGILWWKPMEGLFTSDCVLLFLCFEFAIFCLSLKLSNSCTRKDNEHKILIYVCYTLVIS